MSQPSNQPTSSMQASPMVGALAITASVFVAGTSIFVAILALVAGMHQGDDVGLANQNRTANEAAGWWCYGLAVAVMVNAYFAGKARSKPIPAAITSVIFLTLSIAVCVLYLQTW